MLRNRLCTVLVERQVSSPLFAHQRVSKCQHDIRDIIIWSKWCFHTVGSGRPWKGQTCYGTGALLWELRIQAIWKHWGICNRNKHFIPKLKKSPYRWDTLDGPKVRVHTQVSREQYNKQTNDWTSNNFANFFSGNVRQYYRDVTKKLFIFKHTDFHTARS